MTGTPGPLLNSWLQRDLQRANTRLLRPLHSPDREQGHGAARNELLGPGRRALSAGRELRTRCHWYQSGQQAAPGSLLV